MSSVTPERAVSDDLTPRRREILEAATSVLARAGLRGLTHRAVDREAGLAEGSTSAYFRSSDSLRGALADFVARQLAGDVRELSDQLTAGGPDSGRVVSATARLFDSWLENPDLLRARLELTVAATRDEELASRFLVWRGDLVAAVDRVLAARRTEPPGVAPAPSAETLVAALDGVLVAALLKHPERRQGFVRESVDQLLSPLDEAR